MNTAKQAIELAISAVGWGYGWGGERQTVQSLGGWAKAEAWLRKRESSRGITSAQVEANVAAVLKYLRSCPDPENTPLVDCSGLIHWVCGIADTNAKGLAKKCEAYTMAPPTKDAGILRPGTLLFRDGQGSGNGVADNETHVGIYIGNGEVIHAKGQAVGVVREKYSGTYWHECGWLNGMTADVGTGAVTSPAPAQPANPSTDPETPQDAPTAPSGGESAQDGALRFALTRILKKGVFGQDVQWLKRAMQAMGFGLNLTPSNNCFGSLTKAAVQAFQRTQGLEPDGKVGPLTVAVLGGTWGGKP